MTFETAALPCRNTEIQKFITVRVLDRAHPCVAALLTIEYMVRSRMAISYDGMGFYHIACGVQRRVAQYINIQK